MKNRLDAKGKMEYPCKWLYKVIGADRDKVEKALIEIIALDKQNLKMMFSNISKNGNYLAFNVEIKVENEEQRDLIYSKLKKHPDIKAVL
ncbi:MAG: DUF493 domain-containing protein [Candidatus Omnitrophica bacterium]|nr:DUF493 domain-containing protein [Candidatus Omnitrophota bacterium]